MNDDDSFVLFLCLSVALCLSVCSFALFSICFERTINREKREMLTDSQVVFILPPHDLLFWLLPHTHIVSTINPSRFNEFKHEQQMKCNWTKKKKTHANYRHWRRSHIFAQSKFEMAEKKKNEAKSIIKINNHKNEINEHRMRWHLWSQKQRHFIWSMTMNGRHTRWRQTNFKRIFFFVLFSFIVDANWRS